MIATKRCSTCREEKPVSDFHPNRKGGTTLRSQCKACGVAATRRWREHTPRKPRPMPAEVSSRYTREYYERHPLSSAAHRGVRIALRDGVLVRPETCQSCGCACRAQGHHEDYAKPLDVMWLCPRCHRRLHAGVLSVSGEAPNDE